MKYFLMIFFFLNLTVAWSQPAYVYFEKAEEAFNNQSWDAVIKNLDECIKKDAKHDRAHALKAEALLKQNKADLAMIELNAALSLNSKNEQALLNRSSLFLAKKDIKSAEKDLSKAIELNPNNASAIYQKGKLNLELNNLTEAEKDFTKAIEKKCKISDCYFQSFILKSNHKTISLVELESIINQAIDLDKQKGIYYYHKAILQLKLNKNDEAYSSFKSADAYKYRDQILYQNRAPLLLKLNKQDECLSDLNVLINQFKSKNAIDYIMRADILTQKKDLINASKDLNKAITLDKNNPDTYLSKAKLAVAQNKMSTVMPDLNKAIEMGTQNPDAYKLRSDLFFKQKKFSEAASDLTFALKVNEDADLYYQRSKCFYELKNQKAACEDVNKAAALGHSQAKKDIIYVCK
jgi:tetratricopeptide (TPR) repeat protein